MPDPTLPVNASHLNASNFNPYHRAQLAQYMFLAPWCQDKTVLVVGCGHAEGVHHLASEGAAQWIDALDDDATTIQLARQQFAHHVVAYHTKGIDTFALNRTYDRIFCLNALTRSANPEGLIHALFQHCNDQGLLALSLARNNAAGLDFQAVRALLTPYFPYQHIFYINHHLAVSIAEQPKPEPTPVWLNQDRQLDVNHCEAILIVAGKQSFRPLEGVSDPIVTLDGADPIADLLTHCQALQNNCEALSSSLAPTEFQLKAAHQTQLSLEADLLQTREQALKAESRLSQVMRNTRPLTRFADSPLMAVHQQARWLKLNIQREWRRGVFTPTKNKPAVGSTLPMPWHKKPPGKLPSLQVEQTWQNAPLDQLLVNELEWIKKQASRLQLKTGFGKVLVVGQSIRWALWKDAFETHGLQLAMLPVEALDIQPDQTDPLTEWLDASVVILHELPLTERLKTLIHTFRNRNTPVIYDAEQLNHQANVLAVDEALQKLPRYERELALNMAERHRLTWQHCDYAIAANPSLAMELKTDSTPSYVVPMPIGYAQRVLADVCKHPQRFFSEVHARRLWLQLDTTCPRPRERRGIISVLVKLFLRYPTLQLTVHGQWLAEGEEDPLQTELLAYKNRIRLLSSVLSPLERQRQLALHDIMLLPAATDAPLRNCATLSEWVHAAALSGVPTVASPLANLLPLIQDGLDGYFANTPEEWLAHLSHLIEQPNVREQQAKHALQSAMQQAYVENQLPKVISTLEHLLSHYAQHKHPDQQTRNTHRVTLLDVALIITLTQQDPTLSLDAHQRIITLLDMGYYPTLYINGDMALADLRPLLEDRLGRSMGRYHITRLVDSVHTHDVCMAMDWQSVEAAEPVQHRFTTCLRWCADLEADHEPMGYTRLRIEQTYGLHTWQHVCSSPWLAAQLQQRYGANATAIAPWVTPPDQVPTPLQHQHLLVYHDPTQPGHCHDWFKPRLEQLQQQLASSQSGWHLHIMGPFDPKLWPFDYTYHPVPTTWQAMHNWLAIGDALLCCQTGALNPLVYHAMVYGLPVMDIDIPAYPQQPGESLQRYEADNPVVRLPMPTFVAEAQSILQQSHTRQQLGQQGLHYVAHNTISLHSQLSQLLGLAQHNTQHSPANLVR
jgi:2-polyprenyl-3-methyl-5-hydroxy-6-metoxy-1,4-benzoquinol methylase